MLTPLQGLFNTFVYGWRQKTFIKAVRPSTDEERIIFADHDTEIMRSPVMSEIDVSQSSLPYHEIDDDDDDDDGYYEENKRK